MKKIILIISLAVMGVVFMPFTTQAVGTSTILWSVPFTSQAPLREWKNPRFQDACEETSVLMAIRWAKGEKITKDQAGVRKVRDEILKMSEFQEKKYGTYHDTSASSTAAWLIKDYYGYDKYEIKTEVTIKSLINDLKKGAVILVPTNGRLLKNPNFTPPGPERHMLLIKGYDVENRRFITNDPGTRNGEGYKYSEKTLYQAIMDYPTGYHEPLKKLEKTAIIIKKQ